MLYLKVPNEQINASAQNDEKTEIMFCLLRRFNSIFISIWPLAFSLSYAESRNVIEVQKRTKGEIPTETMISEDC